MNKIAIQGTLVRDPEFKHFDGGSVLATYSIAVKGGRENEVSFFDVESWKQTAEALQYAKKGDSVSIHGQLKQSSWQDKSTGQKRSKVVIIGWDVMVFSKPKQRSPQTETESKKYGVPF